ncbi:MAG: AEC family transporter [Salinigranum sp.]
MVGQSLVSVFASSVLPPVAIAAVGYALGTWRSVDVGPLNTVVLYVFVPALVFHSLVTSTIGGETVVALAVAAAAFSLGMMALAELVGRGVGETGDRLSGFVLTSAYPNAGNFGIPVATFAFGAVGRNTAVLFVVVQNVLLYTLGIALVSRGSVSPRTAVRRILSVPLIYAVIAAGVVVLLGIHPPADGTAMRTLGMVGNAAIPLFLLILGLQLADTDPGAALRRTLPAAGLKLLVAPVVGAAVALAVGIGNPTAAKTFVLLCAAPAAILPLLLVVEFGEGTPGDVSGPEYVSAVIFVTLVGSVPVVTLLLSLLRSGLLF